MICYRSPRLELYNAKGSTRSARATGGFTGSPVTPLNSFSLADSKQPSRSGSLIPQRTLREASESGDVRQYFLEGHQMKPPEVPDDPSVAGHVGMSVHDFRRLGAGSDPFRVQP